MKRPFFVRPIKTDRYSSRARRNSVIADPPARTHFISFHNKYPDQLKLTSVQLIELSNKPIEY